MNQDQKTRIIGILKDLGIRFRGNKVYKSDFREIFGAVYNEPEWLLLSDYHNELNIPHNYLNCIEYDEDILGRVILPTSYSITRYGEFLTEQGDVVELDGLVYQYSMKRNPRNVSYAYRIFLNEESKDKSSGLSSLAQAKDACSNKAQQIVESILYDLS